MSVFTDKYLQSVKLAFTHVLLPLPQNSFKTMLPLLGAAITVAFIGSLVIIVCLAAAMFVPLVQAAYFLAALAGFARPVENTKTKDV